MKSDWKKYTLFDVCSRIYSGGTPSTKHPEYWNGNINWLSSGETSQRFIYDTERKITKLGVVSSSTKLAKKGCTVIATAGQGYTRGQASFLMVDTYMNQSVIACEANEKYILPLYLYYNLDNRYEEFRGLSDGTSTRGGLSGWIIKRMEIDIPPLDEQRKIVNALELFDRKIEINNKINDNLQEQAFALFDRLISSSHGDMCILSEVASLNPKRQLTKGSFARCIDMSQLSTSGTFPSGWEMKPYNGGMRFTNGDTIIARITPCLENGKTAYIDFLNDDEVAFGSTEYIVIASLGEYPSEFFYCLARYPSFVDYAVKNMNGSSGRQRVSADLVGKYVLPRIGKEELLSFSNVVHSLFNAIRNNSLENIRLQALREALLPRLMSGELDVSNIDL